MATVSIPARPDLTAEEAQQAFAQHFAGTYEVYATKMRNRNFIVKKSNWSGVGVKVKQEDDKTTFVFTALMPNVILQALFGGLFSYLILRGEWKTLEAEVAQFIETAPAFQPAKPKAKRTPKTEQQAA